MGDSSKPQIAITFDDGPNGIYTTQVLDILKAKGVNASFFVIGKNVVENENIIQRMIEEGHIIGNHSYLHQFWFSLQSATKIVEELKQTQEAVEAITAKKMSFFRPPYGVTNPNITKAVKTTGVKSIGWSLRSYDTVTDSPSQLMNRLTKKLKNGDIVLFHDHCEATIAILPDFIDYVCNQGFEIVGLDKHIGINAYEK